MPSSTTSPLEQLTGYDLRLIVSALTNERNQCQRIVDRHPDSSPSMKSHVEAIDSVLAKVEAALR